MAGILTRSVRWRAALAGVVVVVAWASLAAWSGRITPLARRPVLDGLGPSAPYQWVDPPPELAPSNRPPVAGSFTLALGPGGVVGDLFFTSDNQVTVLVQPGEIGPAPDQRTVRITVDPVDPSGLPPPGGELVAFGNAVRIAADYRPSGAPVRSIEKPLNVSLAYPQTSTLRSSSHQLLFTADGDRWRKLKTADSLGQHMASGAIPGFGTVIVAAVPDEVPIIPVGEGRSPLLLVAVIVAACAILVGVGLVLRNRTPKAERPS